MANLREIRVSRPEPEPGISKRWFESDYFDLFLWYREQRIFHMQLCYGKPMGECAASWRDSHGYFHDGVSSTAGRGGPVPMSELLEAGGSFDFARVNARFLQESQGLDIGLRKFVLEKLHHFALNGATFPDRPPRTQVRRGGFERAADPAAPPPSP